MVAKAKMTWKKIRKMKRDYSYIAVLHNVGSDVSFAGFETLVGKVFKTESRSIETGSLSGVSDPEKNMIETKESTDFRLKGNEDGEIQRGITLVLVASIREI